MKGFLLLSVVAAFVFQSSAQVCKCDSSETTGYFSGVNCTQCDPLKTDAVVAPCAAGFAFCSDPGRPQIERECYGAGTCGNLTTPCVCSSSGVTGKYCNECKAGYMNWPACTTQKCSEITCGSHGKCNLELKSTLPCGIGTLFDPNNEACFELKARDGTITYQKSPLSQYRTACGSIVCQSDETCDSTGSNKDVCCKTGSKLCLDAFGAVPLVAQCCLPSQSCCDGTCCDSDATCALSKTSTTVPWLNPFTKVVQQRQVFARMDWMLPDGTVPAIFPKVCSTASKMSAPSGIRVIMQPLLTMIALLVGAGMVFGATGLAPMRSGLPAACTVFVSIFLCFSMYFSYAILVNLSAYIAVGAAHKGGSIFVFSLVAQFIILAIMCNGFGLGFLLVNGQDVLPPSLVGSGSPSWSVLADCQKYFGHFTMDAVNTPWQTPNDVSWGYCSEGWYSFLFLAVGLIRLFLFLMLVGTGMNYLEAPAKGM